MSGPVESQNMDIEWTLFARDTGATPEGTRDFAGVFNAIVEPGPPFQMRSPFVVVAMLAISPSEVGEVKKLRLDVFPQDGSSPTQTFAVPDYHVASLQDWARLGFLLTLEMPALTFPHAGAYDFVLWVDGESKSMTTMRVVHIDDADEAPRAR